MDLVPSRFVALAPQQNFAHINDVNVDRMMGLFENSVLRSIVKRSTGTAMGTLHS